MGVEWSSWKMTRSPLGRKNCVYLMGGRAGAAAALVVEAFAPPLDPFCASDGSAGAKSSVTSAAVSRRFQSMCDTSESVCGAAHAPRGFGGAHDGRRCRLMNPGNSLMKLRREF